jgi:hypothetical protein
LQRGPVDRRRRLAIDVKQSVGARSHPGPGYPPVPRHSRRLRLRRAVWAVDWERDPLAFVYYAVWNC